MKYKFIRANKYLYFDDELIQLLEEYSKKGWKLKSMNPLGFILEPCDRPLKYAIDYNELNDEYREIIEKEGYEHIYRNAYVHIYSNENLNAVDLHTDDEIHDQILLRHYNKISMFFAWIAGVIFIVAGCYIGRIIFHQDLNYYQNYEDVHFALTCLLGGLFWISCGFNIYMRRKAIYNQTYTFDSLNKYRIIQNVLLIITSLYMVIVKSVLLVGLCFIIVWAIPNYVSDYLAVNQQRKWKKGTFKLLAVVLFIFVYFAFDYYMNMKDHQVIEIPHGFPNEDVMNIIDNKYLYNISFYGEFFDCNQEYFISKSDTVNKAIFQGLIQDTECFVRELSQAKTDDGEVFYDIPELDNYDYDKALKAYKPYSSLYFKECYILKDYVIARDGNVIVRLKVKDNIDQVLKQYKEFDYKVIIEKR